ncbi:hypothetical protein M3Y97_00601700 [Aphelenchoides bicaudatus]|nr:hypothetical protein M3Y97_00601700 [Aphelenchoides bicaudatus]
MNNETIIKFKICLKSIVTFNSSSGIAISRVFELVEVILGNESANFLAKYGIHKFVREHAYDEIEIVKSEIGKEDILKTKCMVAVRSLQQLDLALNQKPQNFRQNNGDLFNELDELRVENNRLMADNDHLNSINQRLKNDIDQLEFEGGVMQNVISQCFPPIDSPPPLYFPQITQMDHIYQQAGFDSHFLKINGL